MPHRTSLILVMQIDLAYVTQILLLTYKPIKIETTPTE